MTGSIDARRLAEALAEAVAVLGVTALPVAWRMLDSSLSAVLGGMLALLTAGIYALHAVTFDCFRMTGHREKRSFSYTQREE
jgi:F0F1-type ATP synthase assembly protein I